VQLSKPVMLEVSSCKEGSESEETSVRQAPHSDRRPDCARCKRPLQRCVCDALPRASLDTKSRIAVVLHPKEAKRKLGTVPLLGLCLRNFTVTEGARFPEPDEDPELHALLREDDRQCALVFPGPDAEVLVEPGAGEPPRTLIFVDGTWVQAKAMVNKSPWLLSLPRVVIHSSENSGYVFRKQPVRGCLSTLEAVAEALVALEGDRGQVLKAALLAPFHQMVALQCTYVQDVEDKNALPEPPILRPFVFENMPKKVLPGADDGDVYCIVRNSDRCLSDAGIVVVEVVRGSRFEVKRRAALLSQGKTRGRRYWTLPVSRIPDGCLLAPEAVSG